MVATITLLRKDIDVSSILTMVAGCPWFIHSQTFPIGKRVPYLRRDGLCKRGNHKGGTGITPMLQVIHAIFRDPNDKTCVKMKYANQSKFIFAELECHTVPSFT